MDNWGGICVALSHIFAANQERNFGINLTPIEVAEYVVNKVLFLRTDKMEPEEIKAALFVTNDGECGFISYPGVTTATYRYLTSEFLTFVLSLPEDMRSHLWCRIQKNNGTVQKLVKRLGFQQHSESETSYYYTFGGT